MGEATLAELWDDFAGKRILKIRTPFPQKRSLLHPHPSRDGGYFQGDH